MSIFNLGGSSDGINEKPSFEIGKFYALYRGFLTPTDLDHKYTEGWELVSMTAAGGTYGYYFKSRRK